MTLNDTNALRWYTSLDDQNHNKWWAYGRVYPLITPTQKLLPFQMQRDPTNEPITGFSLVDFNTGTETSILSGMETAGLTMFNHGSENYANDTLSEQDPGTDTANWGFSFAPANTQFRYLQTMVSLYDIANVPTDFRCVVRDEKGGTELGSVDISIGNVLAPSVQTLTFDFGSVITYDTASTAMWVEIRSNGHFYPYGSDSYILTYTPEQEAYGTSPLLNSVPSTDIGSAGDYDAHVRVWGAVYDYDLICYPGRISHGTVTPEGRYYAKMTDADNTYYSEVFTIVEDVTKYLKIEYWHRYDFVFDGGHIKYDNPVVYKSTIYLDTDIGKPKYLFEEKVNERNHVKLKIHQSSAKVFVFEFFAPEYLLDAMRIIRMHHDVIITDRNGQEYTVDDFIITPNWQKDGDIAVVECEFRTNTVIVQNGDNVQPLPDASGLGQWEAPSGDFWWTPSGEGWEYA